MKTLPALFFLQVAQNEHDKFAHQEIIHGDKKLRLNHYTLHFFKYASNLDDIISSNENLEIKSEKALKQIRDIFLLLLAIGNTFNKSWDEDFNISQAKDFRSVLKAHFSPEISLDNYIERAFATVFKKGAKLAKTMESLDHMEPVHIREMFNDSTTGMLKDLLPIMAFMQESLGIDFEENIHITHAAIKSKKPWDAINYMNSKQGCLVENGEYPLLNLHQPFSDVKEQIRNYLSGERVDSVYSPFNKDLVFKETEVDISIKVKEKNDLIQLQVLQYEKEKEIQSRFNTYASYNVKEHLENCSFRIVSRLLPLSILLEDREKNRNEIVKNVVEAFSYILSAGTKMNRRLDRDCHGQESFKEILNNAPGTLNRVLELIGETCTKLADWNILSASLDEDNLNSTSKFVKIYDELILYSLSLMSNLEKELNINFQNELEKSFKLTPIGQRLKP